MSPLSVELTVLEARGLLRVVPEQERPVVRFKHALIRDVTYASILQTRRSELHRAVARSLTRVYPEPDLEMVLTIADHWQRAGEDARALDALLPHTDNLIYTGRGPSLTALLGRLDRARVEELGRRDDVDMAVAEAHAARGEYAEARSVFEGVLEHAAAPELRAHLLHRVGGAAYHLGDYHSAIDYHRQSLTLAEQLGDLRRQARAANGLGLDYWGTGDTARALQFLEQARTVSAQLGETLELADAEYNLAGVWMDRGAFEQACPAVERSLALYDKLGHTSLAARSLQLLGACHYVMGDLPTARTWYERALDASRKMQDRLGCALAQSNLAELHVDLGELAEAVTAYGEAVKELRALKLDFYLAGALAGLGEARGRQAQAEPDAATASAARAQAETYAREALAIAQRIGSPEREGIARRVLSTIQLDGGDAAGAQTEAGQAVKLLEQLGSGLELRHAYQTLGEALSRSDDPAQKAQGAEYLQRAGKGAT